jgi:hypothetical protein
MRGSTSDNQSLTSPGSTTLILAKGGRVGFESGQVMRAFVEVDQEGGLQCLNAGDIGCSLVVPACLRGSARPAHLGSVGSRRCRRLAAAGCGCGAPYLLGLCGCRCSLNALFGCLSGNIGRLYRILRRACLDSRLPFGSMQSLRGGGLDSLSIL